MASPIMTLKWKIGVGMEEWFLRNRMGQVRAHIFPFKTVGLDQFYAIDVRDQKGHWIHFQSDLDMMDAMEFAKSLVETMWNDKFFNFL